MKYSSFRRYFLNGLKKEKPFHDMKIERNIIIRNKVSSYKKF